MFSERTIWPDYFCICKKRDSFRVKKITQWKCFYEYFGIRVVEKREDGTDSNIVTRSNLEKGQDKNFSDQEMKDFALICSIFISRRE